MREAEREIEAREGIFGGREDCEGEREKRSRNVRSLCVRVGASERAAAVFVRRERERRAWIKQAAREAGDAAETERERERERERM